MNPGDTLVPTACVYVYCTSHTHMLLMATVAVMVSYLNQETSVYKATTHGNIIKVHL